MAKKLGFVLICVLSVLAVAFFVFTPNWRARNLGQVQQMFLPCGQKVAGGLQWSQTGTSWWSGTSLWVPTRPANPDESFTTITFREFSARGVVDGKVEVVERACP
jgi:hypothetical protein